MEIIIKKKEPEEIKTGNLHAQSAIFGNDLTKLSQKCRQSLVKKN